MNNKNSASMDPYQDGDIPMNRWSRLDGQEYQPSPQIVPDTRIGFDENGHFHAVEHFTLEAIQNAITPFRWAQYLQDAVEQFASTSDYTMGASDRDDFVQDLVSERMESLDSMEERYQLEEALEIWRKRYHYDVRD